MQVIVSAERWGAAHAYAVVALSQADADLLREQHWLPPGTSSQVLSPGIRSDVAAIPPPADVAAALDHGDAAQQRASNANCSSSHGCARSLLTRALSTQTRSAAPDVSSANVPNDPQHSEPRHLFLCCVRLSPEKEPERFVDVCAQLDAGGVFQKHGVTPFLLASTRSATADALVRRFEKEVSRGVVDRRFLGPEQLAAVFAETALNFHPCRYDAYGMTIVEAASQGAPSLMHAVRRQGPAWPCLHQLPCRCPSPHVPVIPREAPRVGPCACASSVRHACAR